jgi:hypothetical protein
MTCRGLWTIGSWRSATPGSPTEDMRRPALAAAALLLIAFATLGAAGALDVDVAADDDYEDDGAFGPFGEHVGGWQSRLPCMC